MNSTTNKLTIYLIKKEYSNHRDILKNYAELLSKDLESHGVFYYGNSITYKPFWLEKFFNESLGDIQLYYAGSRGVLLIEIEKDHEKRIFAITFGHGWQLLRPGAYEERFGLITALNIIDPEKLRKIDKKNMSAMPKDTTEQLTKSGSASDFGIDIEQDLICSVAGKAKDNKTFGELVTGRGALSLSVKKNLQSIKSFLGECYEKSLSKDYKKDFEWIDQISEIKDPNLKEELNVHLISNLKNNSFDKTWMAVPEVIEWHSVSGFKYTKRDRGREKDDIYILDFISTLSEKEKADINLDILKKKSIYCINAENGEIKYQWTAFNCLYCEIQDDSNNKTFLLSNGKWYEIESEFARKVNNEFIKLRDTVPNTKLPVYACKNEAEYNEKIPLAENSIFCLDRKLITHGGGYSKIEFCDLFTKEKKIIHVKRYGGSSVLNHLFSQGLVSGELFLSDSEFRGKLNNILQEDFKLMDAESKPNPLDYEIIFGIISSSKNQLEIPFFSKVGLRNAKKRLETFGFRVSLLKIPVQD